MKRRKRLKRVARAGVIIGAATGILLGAGLIFSDRMIIIFGIKRYDKMLLVVEALFTLGIGMFLLAGFFPFLKDMLRERQTEGLEQERERQKARFIREYAENTVSPELTREMLNLLAEESPGLDGLMKECAVQMDEMDMLQKKQQILIDSNGADYLDKTVEIFDRVEQEICRRLRDVINICIVTNTDGIPNMTEIRELLDSNEERLKNAQNLLEKSRQWVRTYNRGEDVDREVERWMKTIEDSLKEG